MDIDSPPSNSYDDLPLSDAQHAGHYHINLPHFSASFPLPFRVLTLVGLEILLWAINLHVLTSLGVDAASALDLTEDESAGVDSNSTTTNDGDDDDEDGEKRAQVLFDGSGNMMDHHALPPTSRIIRLDSPSPGTPTSLSHPPHAAFRTPRRLSRRRTNLHPPVYTLFSIYTLWVGLGWSAFRYAAGQGGPEEMDGSRWIIGIIVLGLVVGLTWRRGFLARSLKRILSPPWDHAPFFADVILADVLTSFAKVLGDFVVSGNQIWGGGLALGRVRMSGLGNYIKLGMICIPYCLRLRQCIQEYLIPHQTSSRPLFNALKYASAFPVIFLSAAQRNVLKEIAELKGLSVEVLEKQMHESQSRWFGESRTFRLWLLAVLINSLFSFWWDVSNDWGLSMLQTSTWTKAPVSSYSVRTTPDTRANIVFRNFRRLVRSVAASLGIGTDSASAAEEFELGPHRRSPFPSPGLSSTAQFPNSSDEHGASLHPGSRSGGGTHTPFAGVAPTGPFGLRSRMLFPDPFVYYLFILLDLVLRFTWSLKLSSHLHTISEIESGVFIMEALELGRRWMWVFLRVEWEEVKRLDARAQERQFEMEESARVAMNGSATTQMNGLGLGLLDQVDRKAPIVR